MRRYFTFDNQNLHTVMQEIGAWYNLTVIFQSPHLLDERIHFSFSRQCSVDTLLQVLNDMDIAQFVKGEEGIIPPRADAKYSVGCDDERFISPKECCEATYGGKAP